MLTWVGLDSFLWKSATSSGQDRFFCRFPRGAFGSVVEQLDEIPSTAFLSVVVNPEFLRRRALLRPRLPRFFFSRGTFLGAGSKSGTWNTVVRTFIVGGKSSSEFEVVTSWKCETVRIVS